MLLRVVQCTGQPAPAKNGLVPDANSAKVEQSGSTLVTDEPQQEQGQTH